MSLSYTEICATITAVTLAVLTLGLSIIPKPDHAYRDCPAKLSFVEICSVVTVVGLAVLTVVLSLISEPKHTFQDGPVCYVADYPSASRPLLPPEPPPPPPLPRIAEVRNSEYLSQKISDILWAEARYPRLMASLIQVESSGNPMAVSSANARGLTQLLPSTARWMAEKIGAHYEDGLEFVPEWNVRVGTAYLEYLVDRHNGDLELALTSFNRGEQNTKAILEKYGELPREVKASYSDKVLQGAN